MEKELTKPVSQLQKERDEALRLLGNIHKALVEWDDQQIFFDGWFDINAWYRETNRLLEPES